MAILNSGLQTGVGWAKECLILFKANPNQWLLVSFIYLLIFMMLPSLSGMTIIAIPIMLIWPAFTVLVMMLFRNQEAKKQEATADVIDRLKPKLKQLIILGAVCFAYAVIASLFLNPDVQGAAERSQGVMAKYIQNLFPIMPKFLLLFAPLFLATWFSPMLIVLNDYSIVKAVKSSIAGVLQYALAIGVAWAVLFAIIITLLFLSGMVAGIFIAIRPVIGELLMPVFGFAVVLVGTALMFAFQYVSYRDIFKAAPVTLN